MSERPVELHRSGPPETVLDPEAPAVLASIDSALAEPSERRRGAVADVVAAHPDSLVGWATLGDLGRDDVESYACYRVGYHRGLDRLRASGWKGSGLVRWEHPTNRGFLRSLTGLRDVAGRIGETAEAQRCSEFLAQLDPGRFA